jgi:STE24 endopeptidase
MILTPMEAVIGIALNCVSRRFEWEADRFACELQDRLSASEMRDMGDRLGRALITLHVKNLSTVWVDWMCVSFAVLIEGTCADASSHRYSAYHHSHPTLMERLRALEGFKAKRAGEAKKEL